MTQWRRWAVSVCSALRRISCLSVAMTILGRLFVLSVISCQIYLHRCLRCPGFRCRQVLRGRPDYNLSVWSMWGYVLGALLLCNNIFLFVYLGLQFCHFFFIYGPLRRCYFLLQLSYLYHQCCQSSQGSSAWSHHLALVMLVLYQLVHLCLCMSDGDVPFF